MSSDAEDRERFLRAYFKEPTAAEWGGVSTLATGSALLLSGATLLAVLGTEVSAWGCASFVVVPGGLLTAVSLVRLILASSAQRRLNASAESADHQVDEILDLDLNRIKAYALSTLELDEHELETEPLVLTSPLLWPAEFLDDEYQLLRMGAEGQIRSGAYNVAVLAVDSEKLGIFQCQLNFLTGRILRGSSKEFRFSEVCSVGTVEGNCTLGLSSGKKVAKMRGVEVAATNGEVIQIAVEIPELWQVVGGELPPADLADRAVRAIRAMLRQ